MNQGSGGGSLCIAEPHGNNFGVPRSKWRALSGRDQGTWIAWSLAFTIREIWILGDGSICIKGLVAEALEM